MRDLSGERFGCWTVLSYEGHLSGNYKWRCRCDCGSEKIVSQPGLLSGTSLSCGCAKAKAVKIRMTRHGESGRAGRSLTYTSWHAMRQRCLNKNARHYHYYGGRGITFCERWQVYENFVADMGERPNRSMTLDRIDNDGNYEPGNCRWATKTEQIHNRRGSSVVTLRLPFPISVNAMFADGKTRRFKSQRYADWLLEAGYALNKQHVPSIKGRVYLNYILQEGKDGRRRDLGNYEKGVTDLLVKHGIIEADDGRIVREISLRWSADIEGIQVCITPLAIEERKVA